MGLFLSRKPDGSSFQKRQTFFLVQESQMGQLLSNISRSVKFWPEYLDGSVFSQNNQMGKFFPKCQTFFCVRKSDGSSSVDTSGNNEKKKTVDNTVFLSLHIVLMIASRDFSSRISI